MTAITTDHRQGIPRWFWLLLFVIAMAGPLFAVMRAPGVGRIETNGHAVERHGSEAVVIRECLQRNGADMVWVKRDDPSVYIFCVKLEEGRRCGRWGALFAKFVPGVSCDYDELTAFSPKDGTYHRVTRYLSQFARRLK